MPDEYIADPQTADEAGDDFVLDIDPSVAAAPPTLPSGTYGGSGEVTIVKFAREDLPGDREGQYLSIVTRIEHPTLGEVLVGTSPFGPHNTSLVPNSKSKALKFVEQLGAKGKRLSEAAAELVGSQVVVTVEERTYKDKRSTPPTMAKTNDLANIQLR